MAKYVIEETKTSKYEKDFKFPLINLIPAIVWCIPFIRNYPRWLERWGHI